MRSQPEIDAEIAALEECKKYIPKMTAFGEDNHRNLDLQVEALKGEIDITDEDFEDEYNEREQDAINEALDWKEGLDEESPSSGWDNYKPK